MSLAVLTNMSLRLAASTDSDTLLCWRNRIEVRDFMYNSHKISREEHKEWFDCMLNDSSREWHIFSTQERDCGVVYFTEIDRINSTSSWGFYSGPDAPAGVSLLIEIEALSYAFETLGLRRIKCEVLIGNQQIINLHKKSGFTVEGCLRSEKLTPRGMEDVLLLGMLSEEWTVSKARLEARVARHFTPPPHKPSL